MLTLNAGSNLHWQQPTQPAYQQQPTYLATTAYILTAPPYHRNLHTIQTGTAVGSPRAQVHVYTE